jgi:hypothetical protein
MSPYTSSHATVNESLGTSLDCCVCRFDLHVNARDIDPGLAATTYFIDTPKLEGNCIDLDWGDGRWFV